VPITDLKPELPSSLVNVLDKLLANKPHERFQSAAEAAEALNALIRPKKQAAPAQSPKKPAPEPAPEPRPVEPPPPPVIVKVQPEYPGWFRPLAGMAERNPASALTTMIVGLGAAMAAGFALGWLLKG
jgi:serine/threonine-protein kinase